MPPFFVQMKPIRSKSRMHKHLSVFRFDYASIFTIFERDSHANTLFPHQFLWTLVSNEHIRY